MRLTGTTVAGRPCKAELQPIPEYKMPKKSSEASKAVLEIINEINDSFDAAHHLHRKSRSIESVYRMLVYKSVAYKNKMNFAQMQAKRELKIKSKKFVTELVACTIGSRAPKAYCFGTSHRVVSSPPPQLTKLLNGLGQIGKASALTGSKNIIGKCAEVKAANGLLEWNRNLTVSDIEFTPAIRPRTLEKVARCPNCSTMFGVE